MLQNLDSFKFFLQDKFKSLESVGTNKRKKKLSVPAGKSVNIEDKFNEGYDIAPKNLAKRKKLTLNMDRIKSKVEFEENPKECHDHKSIQ